jgi:hypothetical protein
MPHFKDQWYINTVKSPKISSEGHNFFTQAANFCDQIPGLFHQTSKGSYKTNSPFNDFLC